MRYATLTRTEESDHGTFGNLVTDSGRIFVSAELPWRDLNGDGFGDPMLSRINPGTFRCEWKVSPRLGYSRYLLVNTPGRTGILIHGGNFVGDTKKKYPFEGRQRGFMANASGCILLGRTISSYLGQKCLTHSGHALRNFEDEMNWESFELVVIDSFR